jgi:putative FmdB family regulatory protein
MPLFDFTCKNCSNTFEVFKKYSNKDEPVACPACNSFETDRVVSGLNFQLSGNGWYKDGYSGKS